MKALVNASWLFARTSFPRMVLSKRFVVCAALALLPALVAFLVAKLSSRVGPAELATHLGWLMLLQISVPLVALVAGAAVVSEEIEDRTISYVFTRPIPRASLLLGRFAAAIAWLVPLFALSTWLVLQASALARGKGAPIGSGIVEPLFTAVLAGTVVYASVFAALGALLRHPMIVGLCYAFAVEGFLANLPGRNQSLALQHHLRSLIAHSADPAWGRVEGFATGGFEPFASALAVLACVSALALVAGGVGLSRREIELTS